MNLLWLVICQFIPTAPEGQNEVLDDISDKSYDMYNILVPLYSQGQLALTILGRIFALQCHILHEMYILKDANCDFLWVFLLQKLFLCLLFLSRLFFLYLFHHNKRGDIYTNKNYYTTTIIRLVCKVLYTRFSVPIIFYFKKTDHCQTL